MTDLKVVEKKPENPESLPWKVNEAIMTDIIGRMYKSKVIKAPQMKFLYDDRGILDSMLAAHFGDEELEIIRQTKPDTYLMIIAVHSMGAGMMTIFTQKSKGKKLGSFKDEEVATLCEMLKAYDAYQLACDQIEAKPGSDKKKYLDMLATQAVFLGKRTAGDDLLKVENLAPFARTLYNLGVTIALG